MRENTHIRTTCYTQHLDSMQSFTKCSSLMIGVTLPRVHVFPSLKQGNIPFLLMKLNYPINQNNVL